MSYTPAWLASKPLLLIRIVPSLPHTRGDATHGHQRHKTFSSLATSRSAPTFPVSGPYKETSIGLFTDTDTAEYAR